MNIRTRFTLLFALIVGVVLFFFSIAIYYLSENYRRTDFYERLQDRAIEKFKYVTLETTQFDNHTENQLNENKKHVLSNEKIVILNSDKKVVYKDLDAKNPAPSAIKDILINRFTNKTTNTIDEIGFIYTYENKNYLIFASANDKYGLKHIKNLQQTLTIRGLILMLLIVFIGWFYVGRILKPISNIVQQTDKITSRNLNYRLSTVFNNDEISQLTNTFNKMLERLETSFKIQKRFVSNASHEIRNPLTAINGQIDVALMKNRTPEEYKSTLQSISKEIKNIRILTNNLLELANSEVETMYESFDSIRIDEVLWDARGELLHNKPNYKIFIHFDKVVADEKLLIIKGKEQLLKIAFLNILDNACKFSHDNSVNVSVFVNIDEIILLFIDKGIGIPEHYLKHIFEPFSRGNNTHGIPGSGIGLSLTHRIIKLHSGEIKIQSKINIGTSISVVFRNTQKI